MQWCLIPVHLYRAAADLLGSGPSLSEAYAEGWRAGHEAGYDRGYEQAERDMDEAWTANAAARSHAVPHCLLMQRRGEHPPTPCRDPWCPLQTAEARVAAADVFCLHQAERLFREATGPAQAELPT